MKKLLFWRGRDGRKVVLSGDDIAALIKRVSTNRAQIRRRRPIDRQRDFLETQVHVVAPSRELLESSF